MATPTHRTSDSKARPLTKERSTDTNWFALTIVVFATLYGALYWSTWNHGMLTPVVDDDITTFEATYVHDQLRDLLVARSIREDGRPRLFGQNFIIHPPLFFALISFAYGMVGEWITAGHLVVVLASMASLVAFGFLVRTLAGPRAGALAVLVLGAHPMYYSYSTTILHPTLLCFLFSSVTYCYLRACQGSMRHLVAGTILSALGMVTKLNFAPCYLALGIYTVFDALHTGDGRKRLGILAIIIAGGALTFGAWSAYKVLNGMDTALDVVSYIAQFQVTDEGQTGSGTNPFLTLHTFTGLPVFLAALAAALVIKERRSTRLLLLSWVLTPIGVFALSPVYFEWKFVFTVLLPMVALAIIAVMELPKRYGLGEIVPLVLILALITSQLLALPLERERDDGVWTTNRAIIEELSSQVDPASTVLSPTLCREIALISDLRTECLPADPQAAMGMMLGFRTQRVFSHHELPFIEEQGVGTRIPLLACEQCSLYYIDLDALFSRLRPNAIQVWLGLRSSDGNGPIAGARARIKHKVSGTFFYTTDVTGRTVMALDEGLNVIAIFAFGFEPAQFMVHVKEGRPAVCSTADDGSLDCMPIQDIALEVNPRPYWVHGYPYNRI